MLKHSSDIIDEIITAVIKDEKIVTKTDFQKLCNSHYAIHKLAKTIPNIAFVERYHEMISDGRIMPSQRAERIFRKRGVRNQSGIAVISLLTKFWGCPGKCIFCPNFEGLPRSYIPDEPAVMRAQMNEFDPVKQVHNRLRSLRITGHCIDKCDVRIIGGTWSVYPKLYQEMFIKAIYDAHTTYEELEPFIVDTSMGTDRFAEFKMREGFRMRESATLEEAKERNMKSRSRVVGIQIETRPDWITVDEIKRLRTYDVTRVEIGYQTTIDAINEMNKRGHGNAESIQATQMLKDAGFKVCAHIMPNLLGSTPELDRKSLKEVFDNPLYRPDELKIYPMMVTDKSELTEIWRNGGFTAYDDETLIKLMADLLEMVPPYIRMNRVYRDIPAHQILHGSHLANLRQVAEELLTSRGGQVIDTASREVKGKVFDTENIHLVNRSYEASLGQEYLLSFEEKTQLPPEKGGEQRGHNMGGWENGGQNTRRKNRGLKTDYIPYRPDLTKKAQENRKNSTPFEYDMYYKILKVGLLEDYKFLRQKPLLDYIVDFYCADLKLIIEIDGDTHADQEIYDLKRTREFSEYGLTVLRFTNLDISHNGEGVYETILDWIQKHLGATPPTPLLRGEGTIPTQSINKNFHTTPADAPDNATLYALLRLRIPSQHFTGEAHFLPVLENAAIIREIHTFGEQLGLGERADDAIQHQGLGKNLVAEAERIVREQYPTIKKIAVIAGVGVRPYFEKLGYQLEEEYMVKKL